MDHLIGFLILIIVIPAMLAGVFVFFAAIPLSAFHLTYEFLRSTFTWARTGIRVDRKIVLGFLSWLLGPPDPAFVQRLRQRWTPGPVQVTRPQWLLQQVRAIQQEQEDAFKLIELMPISDTEKEDLRTLKEQEFADRFRALL